jgi:hypothetical protein
MPARHYLAEMISGRSPAARAFASVGFCRSVVFMSENHHQKIRNCKNPRDDRNLRTQWLPWGSGERVQAGVQALSGAQGLLVSPSSTSVDQLLKTSAI